MIRLICLALCALTLLVSCGGEQPPDYLAYQNGALHIEAVFNVNGSETPALVELDAPEFDEEGNMLARSGSLTVGGSGLISGVSFRFEGGKAYVVSGVLKIPIENEETISGITDMLSLFCIDPDSFYDAEKLETDGERQTKVIYTNGGNDSRVEVLLGEDKLPIRISASLDDRILCADISEILQR